MPVNAVPVPFSHVVATVAPQHRPRSAAHYRAVLRMMTRILGAAPTQILAYSAEPTGWHAVVERSRRPFPTDFTPGARITRPPTDTTAMSLDAVAALRVRDVTATPALLARVRPSSGWRWPSVSSAAHRNGPGAARVTASTAFPGYRYGSGNSCRLERGSTISTSLARPITDR